MIKSLLILFLSVLAVSNAFGQNYDEAKVAPYTLPEVLQTRDGKFVRSKSVWEKKRRPEIVKLFEDHVYGQVPVDFDSIHFEVSREVADAMEGKAKLKEVTIGVWRQSKAVDIHLTLFIPNNRENPAPAFLLINNRGKENTDPTRAVKSEFWPAEMVVEAGYAIAAIHVSDAAPDDKEKYGEGVLQLYPEQMVAANGMKAIGAWGWAASRVMDYFENDNDIDAQKVIIVGHSRGGKAALWAGAQDQRFAIVVSNNSGNTGAALSRRNFGETVKVINEAFPHWFSDNYKKYNDNESALPVDQHMLLALMAPRPLYVTSASEDLWADPKGSYLSLVYAKPVYDLYRKSSALSPEPPPINTPVINSTLAYHNREGIHNLTAYDWQNFILFADDHFFGK